MSRLKYWQSLLPPLAPEQPATDKPRLTYSPPSGVSSNDSKGGMLLSDWFTMLTTRRGVPRDKALKYIENKLRTGLRAGKLGTKPELPGPTQQDKTPWRLRLVGTDGMLYVVCRDRRFDAREILVFEILLAPFPPPPETMQALYPKDAAAVGTPPKPAAPKRSEPESDKPKLHPTAAWIVAEARRMKAAGQIPADIRIKHFAEELWRRMSKPEEYAAEDKPPRLIGPKSIENRLRDWGLWPVSLIK